MIALPVSYVAMLVFGIPSLVLLEKFGYLKLSWLIVTAGTQGVVVIFLFFAALSGFSWPDTFHDVNLIPRIVNGASMAVAVAVAFWYISGHNTLVKRTW